MLVGGARLNEEIAIACHHCGAVDVRNLGWVQVHWNFQCRRCGGLSRLDKDRLSLILAGRKPVGSEPATEGQPELRPDDDSGETHGR
jgi:hypothetical protein